MNCRWGNAFSRPTAMNIINPALFLYGCSSWILIPLAERYSHLASFPGFTLVLRPIATVTIVEATCTCTYVCYNHKP